MPLETPRIHLEYQNDSDWKLYNGDSLELCSESYSIYSNLFDSIYVPMKKPNPKIMIIGGGDRQLSTIVECSQEWEYSLDIIDPFIAEYEKFSSVLKISSYTPGHITKHPVTFKEWYDENILHSDCLDYDQIIIDCSESIVSETKEIYNRRFPYELSNLLSEANYSGEVYLYVPQELNEDSSNEFILSMFRTFEIQEEVSADVPTWGESATFMKFNIKSKYHVHYTATVNVSESPRRRSSFLLNDKHQEFLNLIERILLKYDFDIKVKTSFAFPTGGHSGSFILGESHCNWHTFPESSFFQIDIYHCKYNPEMDYIFKDIVEEFQIESKDCYMDKNLFNPLSKFK